MLERYEIANFKYNFENCKVCMKSTVKRCVRVTHRKGPEGMKPEFLCRPAGVPPIGRDNDLVCTASEGLA